ECMSLTGSCADQKVKTCPSGSYISMSLTTVTQVSKCNIIYRYLCISTKVKLKYCAGDCQSGSINIGIAITLSVCCDADLCNSQDAPGILNGAECLFIRCYKEYLRYSCDGQSFSNILSCSGSEEHCISKEGDQTLMVLKDCVSKSMCNTKTSVRDVQSVSCCEGNLCNGVQSITQSFLFLCCSLISFILLH
uniref:Uncharacterized protein n=1 Tax=Cyprinus carpio TaxID=7962 RepID=A0A8C1S8A0_CYPCA